MNCERLVESTAISFDREFAATDSLRCEVPVASHIPHEVCDEICRQASDSSERQLGQVIAATLVQHEVNWRSVGLDEMKRLVVTATIASRRR